MLYSAAAPLARALTQYLCMVRHGESLWNEENRFTGWVDVPLTDVGREQARAAGRLIRSTGIRFHVAYSSALSRAVETARIIIAELGYDVPLIVDPRLNERRYGDLEGLNKDRAAEAFGAELVRAWRRGFRSRPPGGESLEDVQRRVVPFFRNAVITDLREGRNVLLVAHGNTLRAIIAHIDGLSDEQVENLEVRSAVPILYTYDTASGRFVEKKVLG